MQLMYQTVILLDLFSWSFDLWAISQLGIDKFNNTHQSLNQTEDGFSSDIMVNGKVKNRGCFWVGFFWDPKSRDFLGFFWDFYPRLFEKIPWDCDFFSRDGKSHKKATSGKKRPNIFLEISLHNLYLLFKRRNRTSDGE